MLKLSNIKIPVRIAIACLLPLLAFTILAGKELLDRRAYCGRHGRDRGCRRSGADHCRSHTRVAEGARRFASGISIQEKSLCRIGCSVSARWSIRRSRPGTSASPNIRRPTPARSSPRISKSPRSGWPGLPKLRSESTQAPLTTRKSWRPWSPRSRAFSMSSKSIDDMTENGQIIHQATAMVALMRRKEYAAQGRGWGVIGFGSGQFVPQMYQAFMRTQNLADAFTAIFNRSASPAQIDFVNNVDQPADQRHARQDAAGRGALALQRQRRQRAGRGMAGRHQQVYRRSQARRRSPSERFRGHGARRRCGRAVGILEHAGARARAPGRHLRRRRFVVLSITKPVGATGRHDGDAGRRARTTSRCPAPSVATSSGTWRGPC